MKPIDKPATRATWMILAASVLCLAGCISGCVVFQPVTEAPAPPPQTSPAAARGDRHAERVRGTQTRDPDVVLFGSLPAATMGQNTAVSSMPQIQHTWSEFGGDFDPDIDPSGRRLVFASTRHAEAPDIYMKSVDGATVTQLTTDGEADIQPVFSPDAEQIAFASRRSGNWDIWVMNLADRNTIQITRTASTELHPSWSPDGSRLVFCRWGAQSRDWELWIVPLGAEGPGQFIGFGMCPRWSPAGDYLLFQKPRRRGERLYSIWVMELHDGEPGYGTEIAASDRTGYVLPSWSRDGERIAFCEVDAGGGGIGDHGWARSESSVIWSIGRDGRGRVQLTDGVGAAFGPAWSPDGRLYFSSNRSGPENIWSVLPASRTALPGSQVTRARGPDPWDG